MHLKLDTGLSRNGVAQADWPRVFARAAELERGGRLRVRRRLQPPLQHLAADDAAQLAVFERGRRGRGRRRARSDAAAPRVDRSGDPRCPRRGYDVVRIGIGMYGLSPFGDGTTAPTSACARR